MDLRPKKLCAVVVLTAFVFSFSGITSVNAEVAQGSSLSSDSFRVLDPQHGGFAGVASSSSGSFRLIATVGDISIGSSSATSFGLRSGFLYFPKVIAATLTGATAGDGQVALTWLAAEGFQGFNVSGYNVCTKPSAGSYTCQNVGSVLSYTKTGLTNGTAYTFKIQARDGLGDAIADSNELSATPASGATPTPTPVPGGGSGGGPPVGGTIILTGFGYRTGSVYILRDAQMVGSVGFDSSGKFSFTNNYVSGGTYKYSLYGVDATGRHSALTSVLVTVPSSGTKTVGNLVLPPTISLANDQLKKGDPLVAHGYTFPGANIYLEASIPGVSAVVPADTDGFYEISFPTSNFPDGVHYIQSRATMPTGQQSVFSNPVGFGINVPFKKRQFNIPGCGLQEQPDLNCDGRVNIIDVSILMFYFRRPLVPGREFVDFSGDGKVDLTEFSIMVYYWTG